MKHTNVVWITGATRGLGRALAEGFAELGWRVAGCGRSAEAVRAVAEALGEPHWFSEADVAEDRSVARFVAAAAARTGPPHLLLNNAAIINANAPLWEVSAEEFGRVVDVNVKGVANLIRHVVPLMAEAGRGITVNFSSGWGRSTSPDVAPYCATKWAVEGLSGALAQELPPGLAAVAVNPGVIDTEMLRSCFGSGAAAYPSPRDWARRAVPFFASLDARCNGQALTVP